MRTFLHDPMIKTAVVLLFLIACCWEVQAQIPQRIFAGVDKTLDDRAPTLGLHVSTWSTPDWKNAGWPSFPVHTTALSFATGSPKILVGGSGGVLRPFTNPT